MTQIDLAPGPAEVAAAYLPPGAALTAGTLAITPRDADLGWYVTSPGALLRPATTPAVAWHLTPASLCQATGLPGIATWSAVAEYLACAARAAAVPAIIYVGHSERDGQMQVTGLRPGDASPLGRDGGALLAQALRAASAGQDVIEAREAAAAAGPGDRAASPLTRYSQVLRAALRPLVTTLLDGQPAGPPPGNWPPASAPEIMS